MDATFEFLLRLGDNALILGHRLSEWCGHAPMLEEDIATANTALDLIGQATNWLNLAAAREGQGRSADDLAMHRDAWDFRNLLLVEQPNGDFGQTLMRQMLFDHWHLEMLSGLESSSDMRIAEIAAKSVKEVTYHAERSGDLVIRLGDGTQESHARMQAALDLLYPYVSEMVTSDALDEALAKDGIAPAPEALKGPYLSHVADILNAATLSPPDLNYPRKGGKSGAMHSEHLGHLLATMQILPRSYPDASW